MSHLETTLIAGYKIPNLQRWSDKYLVDTLGDRLLSVAVTPNGLGLAFKRQNIILIDTSQVCRRCRPWFRREAVLCRAILRENDHAITSLETGAIQ